MSEAAALIQTILSVPVKRRMASEADLDRATVAWADVTNSLHSDGVTIARS
jgi:hypothetical protein